MSGSVKLYELFPVPGDGFSNRTAHYSGVTVAVAATSNKQAHALAHRRCGRGAPTDPSGSFGCTGEAVKGLTTNSSTGSGSTAASSHGTVLAKRPSSPGCRVSPSSQPQWRVASRQRGSMSESEPLSGDLRETLQDATLPSYIVDKAGVIRWVNRATIELLGDVRGRHYTSVVAPEETHRARELFTRKIVGAASATETEGVLIRADGTRVAVELCAAPLRNSGQIVGVFGQLVGELEERPTAPHPDLTPRQAEVLRLLERGCKTQEIADDLHLTTDTVRNHIKNLLRALGVHSRIEAVAVARRGAWMTD
jgi:PAS domain S-box-containing protein